jgi:alpha-1,6-mannosyltransferase
MLNPLRSARYHTWCALAAIAALEMFFWRLYRLRDLRANAVETIAIGLAAGVIYLIALYALEHTAESRAGVWLVLGGAVLFRLTLLPLAPTLSTDLYRYRWDGRVQNAGWNPYALAPNDPRLAALRDGSEGGMPGPEIPSIYPPLSELTFRAAAWIFRTPVGFKLPFAAADLLTVLVLAAWLRAAGGARNYRLAIYAWNPLVVVEFAGSGHSDALALAALVAAFVIIRSRPRLSILLLAAAALFKSFPVMLFPVWLRDQGWPRTLRAWANGFVAVIFAAMCVWPYHEALRKIPATMAYFSSRWQDNNASLYPLIRWLTGSHDLAAGLGVGVAVGIALWAALRGMAPTRAAFLIIGAILCFSPNAYSWYFTWIIPFLCFFPNPAWLMLTILQFLSYHVLIDYQILGVWHFDHKLVALTYAPFYALLLAQALWSSRKRAGGVAVL